jgi:hypothetical protein
MVRPKMGHVHTYSFEIDFHPAGVQTHDLELIRQIRRPLCHSVLKFSIWQTRKNLEEKNES